MRIVFFGTSDFAVPILTALSSEHEIVLVITTPDAKVGREQTTTGSPVAITAEVLNLTTEKPASLKNFELENKLRDLNADVFIVVAYGKIIPQQIIDLPQHKTINVHPSSLPKYRGPSPIQSALLAGETETGTSIMLIDSEVDHGPLLAQQKVAIEPADTFITLSEKLSEISSRLLLQTLPSYIDDTITPLPQDHSQATFTKIISKDDGKIDWNLPSEKIYNQYRAFVTWPGVWTTWDDKVLKILECSGEAMESGESPGTVLPDASVACGGHTKLNILNLQLAGKSKMTIKEFLNGHSKFIGSKLL